MVCAETHVLPRIDGDPKSATGATTHPQVVCKLHNNKYSNGVVCGELIIEQKMIGAGVNISTSEKNTVVASWAIQGSKKDNHMHYYFAMKEDLVKNAVITIFSKDEEVFELYLKYVPIITPEKANKAEMATPRKPSD